MIQKVLKRKTPTATTITDLPELSIDMRKPRPLCESAVSTNSNSCDSIPEYARNRGNLTPTTADVKDLLDVLEEKSQRPKLPPTLDSLTNMSSDVWFRLANF